MEVRRIRENDAGETKPHFGLIFGIYFESSEEVCQVEGVHESEPTYRVISLEVLDIALAVS
jgi:hypothetical protein